jgi:CRP/FNR family transcriptional regulator, anaerobic regulatory protein
MTFPGLSPEQSSVLASQFTAQKKLATGKYFLKEGKVCSEIGIVTKGMCRHYYNTADGDVTRWVGLTGTFVTSLRSFIAQIPAVENIQAMETTEIAIMPRANWMAIYNEHEFIRNFWTKQIEENYIGMEERVFNLIAKSAEERYQWMQENQPRFIREVPDKYLASMLGIHPRHLTRIRAMKR